MSLGAAPKQVFIDGIAQLKTPHVSKKPSASQSVPKTPDFTKEAKEALKYDGLPPLDTKNFEGDTIIFTNVNSVFLRDIGNTSIREAFSSSQTGAGVVVVQNAKITCVGSMVHCTSVRNDAKIVNLEGGSISYVFVRIFFNCV